MHSVSYVLQVTTLVRYATLCATIRMSCFLFPSLLSATPHSHTRCHSSYTQTATPHTHTHTSTHTPLLLSHTHSHCNSSLLHTHTLSHPGYEGFSDPAQSSGFCVFNSVAAGALHALDEEGHGVQRVAIIDLDIHHGKK